MELRHLRYFCAVAEEMHVTRAAERLHVAQPALTQQIKALETELDTQLLRRDGRGIKLTVAGETFWREAQSILERVREAGLITKETARGYAGRLAVGLTETASFAPPVTSLLKRAREQWPNVEFNLLQARSDDLLAALVERRIDVAFMRSPAPNLAALQWRSFLSEGFFVAVPSGHVLAAEPAIALEALKREALILPRGRTGDATMRAKIALAFANVGVAPRIVQETPEYIMAINLVAAGFGVSLVPTVLGGLRQGEVVYRPLVSTPPLSTEIIVVTRQEDLSPVATNFLALAEELAPGGIGAETA